MRVERREGLVEEEHVGLAGEGTREPDALALAARELARSRFREVGDPEALQHLGSPYTACIDDVLLDRHVRKEGVFLEDEADAPLFGRAVDPRRRVEEHALLERDPPALGSKESGDRSQDARLAGAGGAHQREGLASDSER